MDQLGIKDWAPLPELQSQGWAVFMSRERPYFHVLLLYKKLWVEILERLM
jgi:hypothetical protein